jgi:hypothetical protein
MEKLWKFEVKNTNKSQQQRHIRSKQMYVRPANHRQAFEPRIYTICFVQKICTQRSRLAGAHDKKKKKAHRGARPNASAAAGKQQAGTAGPLWQVHRRTHGSTQHAGSPLSRLVHPKIAGSPVSQKTRWFKLVWLYRRSLKWIGPL